MTEKLLQSFSGPAAKSSNREVESWTPQERYVNYVNICEMSGYKVVESSFNHDAERDWIEILVVGEK